MTFRFIAFFVVLFLGCRTELNSDQLRITNEENKDVAILSNLIKDYMQQTRNNNFTLVDIAKFDTLMHITKNFSEIEVANWPDPWTGGYAVYFKFAKERNLDSVKAIRYDRILCHIKTKKKIGRNDKQLEKKFDGEIHFYYPERHYNIKEIILKLIDQ